MQPMSEAVAAAGYYDDGSGRKRWWDGQKWTDYYEDTAPKPLYSFVSHIDGKNARVDIWPDRIEWERRAVSKGRVAAAVFTAGASLALTGVRGRNTDMVPIRMISGITSKKGGGFNTVVQVATAGGLLEFRTGHKEAEEVKRLVQQLMLDASQPQTVVVQQAAAAAEDVTDQLHKLKGLHDAGILSDQEFDTKKTELLARL